MSLALTAGRGKALMALRENPEPFRRTVFWHCVHGEQYEFMSDRIQYLFEAMQDSGIAPPDPEGAPEEGLLWRAVAL